MNPPTETEWKCTKPPKGKLTREALEESYQYHTSKTSIHDCLSVERQHFYLISHQDEDNHLMVNATFIRLSIISFGSRGDMQISLLGPDGKRYGNP